MRKWPCFLLLGVLLSVGPVLECSARALFFHATRRAMARQIRTKGFSIWKMRGKSRFGSGVYLSRSPKTAMMERKGANSLLRVRLRKGMNRSSLNLTRPTPKKIRSLVGTRDLSGATKKGIIGPKLGQRLGRYAGKTGRSIRYRSAKDSKGLNLFVPRRLCKDDPSVIRGIQMKSRGRYR